MILSANLGVLPDLFSGLGVLLSGVAAVRAKRAATQALRLSESIEPNHGSSVKDALKRIEIRQEAQTDMLKTHSAELGQIKRDATQVHADHAERLRTLERKITK